MIRLYNSLTRTKETFAPLDPEGRRVGMYYCGPTVYDSLHLGHGRAAVVPDTIRRYLEYRGYQVRYVSNFTDVDDNIIQRAIREDRDWREITSVYMEEYGRITALLGNRPADVFPRATDHVPEMTALAEALLERGNAYHASNGDVYFDVASYAGYGQLAGRTLDEQLADASGRLDDEQLAVKRNPADFILWKLNRNDAGELRVHPERVPGWPSPWGMGRPGWHLECSALSEVYLGMPFDLHGGGADLLFPHHENERAQNCCGFAERLGGRPAVRYWIHNGFINVKATTQRERESQYAQGDVVKMSKSLGNVKWVREMIWPAGPYDPLAVRMLLLSSHYRSPIDFSPDLLDQATSRLARIYGAIDALRKAQDADMVLARSPEGEPGEIGEQADQTRRRFEEAMDDDFNTAAALAAVFELVGFVHKHLLVGGDSGCDASTAPGRQRVLRALVSLLNTLGFPEERTVTASGSAERETALLDLLARVRKEARSSKQYALSDQIRDQLGALGYELRDRAGGESEIVRKG